MNRRLSPLVAPLALGFLLLVDVGGVWADEVQLYRPQSRDAEELAALAGPLLAPEGTAVGDAAAGVVILRGPAEAVEQALAALRSLDVAPRQYRILSELTSRERIRAQGLEVEGWIRIGDVEIGRLSGAPRYDLRVAVKQLRADDRRRFETQIVVLEGRTGEIWTGSEFPVVIRQFESGRRDLRIQETTGWVPVRQGLAVRPRALGDEIGLEVWPIVEDGHPDQAIRQIGAATEIRIRSGESLVIGQLTRDDQTRSGGLTGPWTQADATGDDLLIITATELE
jgi:hypothetical protein